MFVQVNTNHSIEGSGRLANYVETEISQRLHRFADHVTTIEVHLNDTNAGKSGPDDKRCQMEARIAGISSVSVTHNAEDIDMALHGAIEKMKRVLTKTFDQLTEHPAHRA